MLRIVISRLYIVGHFSDAFLNLLKTSMWVYFSLCIKPRHRIYVATDGASPSNHGYKRSGTATAKGIDDSLTLLCPPTDNFLDEGNWKHGII